MRVQVIAAVSLRPDTHGDEFLKAEVSKMSFHQRQSGNLMRFKGVCVLHHSAEYQTFMKQDHFFPAENHNHKIHTPYY